MSTSKNKNSRSLVNRTAFSGALDNNLIEKLHELHLETQIPKNTLYDIAITLLLEKYNKDIHSEKSSE